MPSNCQCLRRVAPVRNQRLLTQEQNDVRISEGSSMVSGTVYFAGDEVCLMASQCPKALPGITLPMTLLRCL